MTRARELFELLRSGGESALDGLIADFQAENLWLDFKRSADAGSATRLHQSDRENFAKAISGFANSDGGIIVWGIDCRRDVATGADLPSDRYPIQQPHRFVSWLENAVSACVTPAAGGIEHAIISLDTKTGFVVTLVPSSTTAPHQSIQPPTKLQYYMRAGSNFVPVPHAVLAGMFGRRPQPRLFTFYEGKPSLVSNSNVLELDFAIRLMNTGPAPAIDPYLSLRIVVPPPNCRLAFEPNPAPYWVAHEAFGIYFNVTAVPNFRLAPYTPARPIAFKLQFAPPFQNAYVFEMHFGAQDAAPSHILLEMSRDELEFAYFRSVDLLKESTWQDAIERIFPMFVGQKGDAAETNT